MKLSLKNVLSVRVFTKLDINCPCLLRPVLLFVMTVERPFAGHAGLAKGLKKIIFMGQAIAKKDESYTGKNFEIMEKFYFCPC